MLSLFGIELNAIEFRNSVYDASNLDTKVLLDIEKSGTSVFDSIVKKRSGDGDVIKTKFGTYGSPDLRD